VIFLLMINAAIFDDIIDDKQIDLKSNNVISKN